MTEIEQLRAERVELIKEVAEDNLMIAGLFGIVEALTAVARQAVLNSANADPEFAKIAGDAIDRAEKVIAHVAIGRAATELQNAPSTISPN